MYPTDLIYGAMFNFSETDSPYEQFEFLGYEGANFVELSGSAIINICLGFGAAFLLNFINWVCVKMYTYSCSRKLGTKLQKQSAKSAILTIYLQSFLEMSICACLAITALDQDDFSIGNGSDLFAAIFVIASCVILVTLPIYILKVIHANF